MRCTFARSIRHAPRRWSSATNSDIYGYPGYGGPIAVSPDNSKVFYMGGQNTLNLHCASRSPLRRPRRIQLNTTGSITTMRASPDQKKLRVGQERHLMRFAPTTCSAGATVKVPTTVNYSKYTGVGSDQSILRPRQLERVDADQCQRIHRVAGAHLARGCRRRRGDAARHQRQLQLLRVFSRRHSRALLVAAHRDLGWPGWHTRGHAHDRRSDDAVVALRDGGLVAEQRPARRRRVHTGTMSSRTGCTSSTSVEAALDFPPAARHNTPALGPNQ